MRNAPLGALKFGIDTRNRDTSIMSSAGQPEPEIGMGATVLGWFDREAATVVNVVRCLDRRGRPIAQTASEKSRQKRARPRARFVTVQLDKSRRIDNNGKNGRQVWHHERDPRGRMITFVLTHTGWKEIERIREDGKPELVDGGYSLRVGMRDHLYDYGS